ncbi:hypothetical protein AAW31_17275 [Nitrosomonas communis]|nr:hypothetical protein AAW31_17275 [Nitrosomonas communis]
MGRFVLLKLLIFILSQQGYQAQIFAGLIWGWRDEAKQLFFYLKMKLSNTFKNFSINPSIACLKLIRRDLV